MSVSEIVLFFCLFGAVQGTLLGVTLGSVRQKAPGDWLLVMFVLGGAATMAVITLSHSDLAAGIGGVLQAIEYTLVFAMPPLLYLYIYLVSGPSKQLPAWSFVHFIPVLAWMTYLTACLLISSAGPQPYWPPFAPIVAFQIVYTTLAFRAYFKGPRGHFWAKGLLGFMIVLHSAQLLRLSFTQVDLFRNVVPLVGSLGFCAFTVLGLRHSLLLRASRHRQSRPARTLDDHRAEREAQRLMGLLVEKRRFLDGGLTLGSLAEELSLSRTYLSRLINDRFGQGFLELVNGYRVDEARRLLSDPESEHLTIDAVASRSGFRSRSTFYEAFRRVTGKTPSSYRSSGQAS